MPKHTYQIEVDTENGWRPMTGGLVGLEYGRGYLGCHRESSGPRIGLRLVRSDGRVMDEAPASTEVSCYAPQGSGYVWPHLARACVRALLRAAEDARRRHPGEAAGLRDVAARVEAVVLGAVW